MDILVSNLNPSLIEKDLQRLFTPFGEISSLAISRDKLNNRSKGRALVSMPVHKEALTAITALNGAVVGGKPIVVSEVVGTDENPSWGTLPLR